MPVHCACVFPVITVIHSHYFLKHYERVDVYVTGGCHSFVDG